MDSIPVAADVRFKLRDHTYMQILAVRFAEHGDQAEYFVVPFAGGSQAARWVTDADGEPWAQMRRG